MSSSKSIEVVAGAGGAKGPGLIGGFMALDDRRVNVGTVTGVSAGSIMSAIYTNGIRSHDLAELYINDPLRQEVADEFNSITRWLNPVSRLLGVIDLEPKFQQLIDHYDLKPNRHLRIIAFNLATRKPIAFEGTRYNLAKAMAASCAIPGVMRPVLYKPQVQGKQLFVTKRASESMAQPGVLVDGGVHHFHPTCFCNGPAIVFKLGTATRLPARRPTLLESAFHVAEMTAGRLIGAFETDSCHNPHDMVIPVGKPDVGGVSFSYDASACADMVDYGYRVAARWLDAGIAQGRIPTCAA